MSEDFSYIDSFFEDIDEETGMAGVDASTEEIESSIDAELAERPDPEVPAEGHAEDRAYSAC